MDSARRRQEATARIVERTGIDEPMIERLVHEFYRRIRSDSLLAPIFAERIRDWTPHLERMCAFWSSVALLSGRYHGRPMDMHESLPIGAAHFDRWLSLFRQPRTISARPRQPNISLTARTGLPIVSCRVSRNMPTGG